MSEWIEWNGGEMPVPKGTKIKVRYVGGQELNCDAGDESANDWRENGRTDDIVAYKILEEEPKGHPNASILMEIAKEAAINNEYWKEFEGNLIDDFWLEINSEINLLTFIANKVPVRRKPRTIRIGNYDVPEFKARKYKGSLSQNSIVVELDDEEHAELMLKALQELLGAKQCT